MSRGGSAAGPASAARAASADPGGPNHLRLGDTCSG
jgi:hypothetical protein